MPEFDIPGNPSIFLVIVHNLTDFIRIVSKQLGKCLGLDTNRLKEDTIDIKDYRFHDILVGGL